MSQADLLHGAQLQLRGALRMKDFDRRRIPTRGLEAVLLPKELKANLDKIVHHEKVGWQANFQSVEDCCVRRLFVCLMFLCASLACRQWLQAVAMTPMGIAHERGATAQLPRGAVCLPFPSWKRTCSLQPFKCLRPA